MSFAVDTNILLYASNRDDPHHDRASELLESWATEHQLVYLPWPVLMAYLRIATHPRIFDHPLAPSEACDNVEALLAVPHVRALGEGPKFWSNYMEASRALGVRGNLVPDAHIVGLMREHGIREIVSNDSDFRKFEGIVVRNPFA